MTNMPDFPALSIPQHIHDIEVNQIVDMADLARTDPDVIKLWVGEPDLATPSFIIDATVAAMRDGETRYTYSLGLPQFHEALHRYYERHWQVHVDPGRFSATIGGMNAIMQVLQSILEPSDEVVIPCPAWPNLLEATRIVGGRAIPVLYDASGDGTIALDLEAIFGAVTEKTRAIAINSPANPTGWIMPRSDMIRLRDFARRQGLWIIADEVYAHFAYELPIAPSFLEICEPHDRLLLANTFSKNWCMTGWRAGWVIYPESMRQVFDSLSQYNTTSTPTFIQRGCIAALDYGDDFIHMQVERCRQSRDIFTAELGQLPNVTVFNPQGTFYMWIAVDGVEDGFDLAVRILKETSVGVAPGSAFGPGGERYLRICFAIDPNTAKDAAQRLASFLGHL